MRRRVGGSLAFLVLLCITPVGVADEGASARLAGLVVHVVDGDTIHVRLGARVEKVRYIGINTPELHHPTKREEPGGREAAAVNQGLIEGKHVGLELDVQQRDRYGRLLAYVWQGDVMINAELVRLGYAQVMTIPPNVRHQALLLRLQQDARQAERGLWRVDRIGRDAPDPGRPLPGSPPPSTTPAREAAGIIATEFAQPFEGDRWRAHTSSR